MTPNLRANREVLRRVMVIWETIANALRGIPQTPVDSTWRSMLFNQQMLGWAIVIVGLLFVLIAGRMS